MRRHIINAACGVLDYISYPLGMIAVAPIVIHKLGAPEYGLWMIATAAISAGGIVASGFCDASTQRIARLRNIDEREQMVRTVRSTLGVSLALSLVLACLIWAAAPFAAVHVFPASQSSLVNCIVCLRLASLLVVVRTVESVGISVHRAFESYSSTVRISTAMRLLTLFSVAVLACLGHRTISFLVATGVFLLGGAYLQLRGLRRFIGKTSLRPSFESSEIWLLLASGVFVWLQALGSVVFTQFDRILLGVSLGAAAVAPYALSVQLAQPLFGLTASGMHFLFPYLSGRVATGSSRQLRHTVLVALTCNLLLVGAGAGALLVCGERLLTLWAGSTLATAAKQVFPSIVVGTALMGLSVTGTYTLQALGLFRVVAIISLGSRAAMLMLMLFLLHHMGLWGLAIARVCYGATMLLVYPPLVRLLSKAREHSQSGVAQLPEGAKP